MFKKLLQNYTLVLASGSPRRQQFLTQMDLPFSIRLKEIDEVYPPHLQGLEITTYLARLKASVHLNTLQPNEILITSDTLVWHNQQVIGKPKDLTDAYTILQQLSDSTHQVLTTVVLQTTQQEYVITETTQVTFKKFTPEMINYYLNHYQPLDKAGAYGIQEWIGLVGIAHINGSYTNIVGMPTEKVFDVLWSIQQNINP